MELITAQARHYVPILEGEDVQEIKIGKHLEAITRNARYISKALIFATGSVHRRLKVPGEDKFYGHGVSYCATCGGYLYKGRHVVVVGGRKHRADRRLVPEKPRGEGNHHSPP